MFFTQARWAMLPLILMSGCILDRSPLACPMGTAFDGRACAIIQDGATIADAATDAHDASSLIDARIDPDASIDAFFSDAGLDAASTDAGARRCEDVASGLCIRLQNLSGAPEVTGWMVQFIWTLPGGAIFRLPDNRDPEGIAVFEAGCHVFRRIDDQTTECEILIPDPMREILAPGPWYAYPIYASGSACTGSGCPNFPAGYSVWSYGVMRSADPLAGVVSQVNRPTPEGAGVVLRIVP